MRQAWASILVGLLGSCGGDKHPAPPPPDSALHFGAVDRDQPVPAGCTLCEGVGEAVGHVDIDVRSLARAVVDVVEPKVEEVDLGSVYMGCPLDVCVRVGVTHPREGAGMLREFARVAAAHRDGRVLVLVDDRRAGVAVIDLPVLQSLLAPSVPASDGGVLATAIAASLVEGW